MKSQLRESFSLKPPDSRRNGHPRLSRRLRDLARFLKVVAGVLRSAVREIFDESAYARFLERHHLTSSRHAYAAFLRESQCQRERRPRCC
jgi:hypothetical protein